MRLALVLLVLLGVAQLAQARGLEVLRNGWWQGLVTTGTVLMLSVPFPSVTALAQQEWEEKVPEHEVPSPQDHWRKVFARSPAEFRAVLHLQIDYDRGRFIEHLLYLGQDRSGSAVFIAMQDAAVGFLLATSRVVKREISFTLQAWDGTMWENVEVDLAHFFPVAELDFYGIALVRATGLELNDFTPVQLASFPSLDTPINQLSYLEDDPFHELMFNDDPNDDGAIVARGEDPPLPQDLPPPPSTPLAQDELPPRGDMSLYWQRCQAGMFDRGTWLGTHSCPSFPDFITQGSVIFNSLTGKAVGFYLIKVELDPQLVAAQKDKVLGFSPEVLTQVEAMFSVSPHDKLPTSWGALKNTR